MKTKVLLSFLAVLCISFIGLARPGDTSGSHANAISPESATITSWVDSHETPAAAQDQEKKEQKKEVKKGVKIEEKEKTTFVLTTKEGEKGKYEIIYVTSPHAKHDKDKNVTWTIKADKLHLSEDAKKIELDEGTFIYINKEDKDGVKVIKLDSPHIQVKKVGKDAEHVTVDVHASPHVEVHPNVHVVIDTDKYAKLIEKIKEKLAKLKEKDLESDVKKVELEAIEETLEELQKVLEKKSDSHSYRIKTKDIHIDGEKLHHAVEIGDDMGAFSLIYHAELDTDQKEAYEKAIKKLEGNLPDGYIVEPKFDEEKGTLLLKITSEKDTVLSKDTLKKLIEEFKKDLEKIKN